MSKPRQQLVASVHNHFNIFRNINEAKEGPVTAEEQIVAIERFIRWHLRQVTVGQRLLEKLKKEAGDAQAAQPLVSIGTTE